MNKMQGYCCEAYWQRTRLCPKYLLSQITPFTECENVSFGGKICELALVLAVSFVEQICCNLNYAMCSSLQYQCLNLPFPLLSSSLVRHVVVMYYFYFSSRISHSQKLPSLM